MEKASRFEKQRNALADVTDTFLERNFGFSPKSVKVLMDQALVVVRVDKFLSPAEIKMGLRRTDTRLIHEMYSKLFDRVKASLVAQIEQITLKDVTSSQININFENELCVINFFLSPKPKTERPQLALLMAPREEK